MRREPGSTTSIWMGTARPAATDGRVRGDREVDVAIAGAGIAGLTTAYLLAREGRRVAVVDRGTPAWGMTARTSAHLSSALDDRFSHLERLHGEAGARLAAESHVTAVDRIESICKRERIDCTFSRVDGYLFAPPGGSKSILDEEFGAAQRAGHRVEFVARAPGLAIDTGRCLRFPDQAQFHPLRYCAGLITAIRRMGGLVFSDSAVESVEGGDDPRLVIAGAHCIRAQSLVVTTNTPINDLLRIHTKQAPYQTYAMALRLPPESVWMALYWDTEDPYHYVRIAPNLPEPGQDVLVTGGEDHKTGHKDDAGRRFAALERWTRARFPMAGECITAWSGEVMEPADSLAFIGRNPGDERIYIATGDSGHGLTHGTIAGILVTDLVQGRDNPWASLYDPARKTLRAWKEFARENLDVAMKYTQLVTPGEVTSVSEVPRGQGAVIRRGLRKLAVYRDDEGTAHICSAICTHLGCVVAWNSAEKTWDCPCHGSRFDRFGKAVQGPANSDLAPTEVE